MQQNLTAKNAGLFALGVMILIILLNTILALFPWDSQDKQDSHTATSKPAPAPSVPRHVLTKTHPRKPAKFPAIHSSTAIPSQAAPNTPRIAVTVPSRNNFLSLLQTLTQLKQTPYQFLPQLNSVVLPNDPQLLAALLKQFPGLTWENDAVIQRPQLPRLTATTPGIPFRDQLLPWLGINPQTPLRGQNVTIAILDQPINVTTSLANASIQQLNPFQLPQTDKEGHGSAVASLMVGQSDHFQGIAPDAQVLSIPVLDEQGMGSIFTLSEAIIQATDRGAQIISLSLGTNTPSPMLQAAVDYATQKGVVLVAAAGNESQNLPVYPAACKNVIGVAACDAAKNATSFSNYGDYVDIAAPGLALAADFGTEEQLDLFSGTSAATPCVAAVIAAILGENPDMTPQQAAETVLQYAEDNGAPGKDPQFGEGVLNYTYASQWNNPNLTDAAATGQFLNLEQADNSNTPLIASAQNTGNTLLDSLTLDVTINGKGYSRTFQQVNPGATVSLTINIPNEERKTIRIQSLVTTHADEFSTSNNWKSSIISVKLQEPTP